MQIRKRPISTSGRRDAGHDQHLVAAVSKRRHASDWDALGRNGRRFHGHIDPKSPAVDQQSRACRPEQEQGKRNVTGIANTVP